MVWKRAARHSVEKLIGLDSVDGLATTFRSLLSTIPKGDAELGQRLIDHLLGTGEKSLELTANQRISVATAILSVRSVVGDNLDFTNIYTERVFDFILEEIEEFIEAQTSSDASIHLPVDLKQAVALTLFTHAVSVCT